MKQASPQALETPQLLIMQRFVRIVNDSGAKAIVHLVDANNSGIGSVTLLNNAVEIIEKHPEDGIYYLGSANIRLARIGITN